MIKIDRLANNQTVIKGDVYYVFLSYESVIAVYKRGEDRVHFSPKYDYSVTTKKYLHKFLSEYTPFYQLKTKELVNNGTAIVHSSEEALINDLGINL